MDKQDKTKRNFSEDIDICQKDNGDNAKKNRGKIRGKPKSVSLSASQHLDFRDRNQESAAPIPYVAHLLHDFVLQIPGQDQQVVWFSLFDFIGVMNRNMCPGQEMSLLVRIPVYCIIYEIRSDATIVQESIPFRRRPISDDHFFARVSP